MYITKPSLIGLSNVAAQRQVNEIIRKHEDKIHFSAMLVQPYEGPSTRLGTVFSTAVIAHFEEAKRDFEEANKAVTVSDSKETDEEKLTAGMDPDNQVMAIAAAKGAENIVTALTGLQSYKKEPSKLIPALTIAAKKGNTHIVQHLLLLLKGVKDLGAEFSGADVAE